MLNLQMVKEENEFTLSFPKYPSSNFSSVRGRIVSVSKNASYSNCGESYFLVKGIINDTSFYDRRNKNKINLIPGMKATARVKGQDPSILELYNLRVKNKGSITAHLSTLQQSQVKNSIPNVIRSTILFQTWKVKISKRTVNWSWKNNP